MQDKTDTLQNFVTRVKRLRGELGGISQVARAMGVSRQTVTECMNGDMAISPKTWTALAMAEAAHPGATFAGEPPSKIPDTLSDLGQAPYGSSVVTRAQIEARLKAFLDTAERVPGGLGYASIQIALHLDPVKLRLLDPAYDPAAELRRLAGAPAGAQHHKRAG